MLRSGLDWILELTTPGIIASGSLSLQIAMAAMVLLSTELWRLSTSK